MICRRRPATDRESVGRCGNRRFDLLPQPAVCGIIFYTFMPIHLGLDVRGVHRKRMNLVPDSSVQNVSMSLREGKQKIGLSDYAAGREAVLASQRHFPAPAQPAEFRIDQTRPEAARRNKHVSFRQISVQIEPSRYSWMTRSSHDDERFAEKTFLMNRFKSCHRDVDGEIEGTTGEFGLKVSALHAGGRNRHLRR